MKKKDLATPKWYRFTGAAGTMMPTSCVPKHYCGTHAPGWLSGSHPTSVGQVVNSKVCFHWSGSCCHWHANIQIKKCTSFFVYKLVRTPVCWLRYCGNAGFGTSQFFQITEDWVQNLFVYKILVYSVRRVYLKLLAMTDKTLRLFHVRYSYLLLSINSGFMNFCFAFFRSFNPTQIHVNQANLVKMAPPVSITMAVTLANVNLDIRG